MNPTRAGWRRSHSISCIGRAGWSRVVPIGRLAALTIFTALILIALLTLAAAPRPAFADNLVLESWVGGPSPQEQQWAASLREGLVESGFLATPSAITQALGPRRPMPALVGIPGQVDLMARFSAARATLAEAISLYRRSRFQSAEKLLTTLVAEAQQNPLIFASENGRPVFRESMAYLVLSLSRGRQTAAAEATAEELVRICPGEAQQIFVQFGPVADKLYRAAEARLTGQGKGNLLVEVNDPDAIVVVNEGTTGNRTFEASVPPGTYRVLVLTPGEVARRYEVPVRARETSRLTIDWQLDRVLALSDEAVSLIFDSDRARGREGPIAVSLARTLGAGPRVIVLGSRIYDGYRAMSASLYDVSSGRHITTALAVMNGKLQDAKLTALKAFFLSGGRASNPNIIVSALPLETIAAVATAAPPIAAAPAPPSERWPAYFAAGSAVAAFGAGVVLIQHDRDERDEPGSAAAPIAYAFFGASVALASYAAYRWGRSGERRPRARNAITAAVAPSSNGAIGSLTWGF